MTTKKTKSKSETTKPKATLKTDTATFGSARVHTLEVSADLAADLQAIGYRVISKQDKQVTMAGDAAAYKRFKEADHG